MAVWTFKALRGGETSVSGTIVADSPRHARDLLREGGLVIHDLAPARDRRSRPRFSRRHGARTVQMLRELSTLLAVGIPLLEALDGLISESRGGFREVLQGVRERIAGGSSLSDALRMEPGVFDELSVSLVEVGERTGTLEDVLLRLAVHKERARELRGRVGNALIYPAIVLVMAVLISTVLMTLVVPNILAPLVQAGRRLPAITRVVKGASDLLVHGWWIILPALGAALAAAGVVLRSARGRAAWDRLSLRVPVLGGLIRKQAISRLAMVVATLMRSGVVFVRAIQVARGSVRNRVIEDALGECERAVEAGEDIGAALERTRAFPSTVVRVFSVGQESGQLEEMLERLGTDYDQQVEAASRRLAAILEPAMIFVLAILVGAIAFATILPILEAGHVL